jgi:hypothetical protein
MRWTKAQFVVFSPQVTVRAITVQDKPRAERDRLLQVKREQRILTEVQIQELVDPVKLRGLEKHR